MVVPQGLRQLRFLGTRANQRGDSVLQADPESGSLMPMTHFRGCYHTALDLSRCLGAKDSRHSDGSRKQSRK
jgi:hypothetical protein